ncbi:Protein N-acetyltransferase, RimJ/RimL family [Pseudomonas pohangensis]|uniref:Protein N-acetyltransferase, RimJ/RimL family n=1 Tax=Pseudomonas pohangensis TaxID=364197 RepID=A0A1H2FW22_9PSED|nr:Protein N-acetyltransferase, RimJ/RimL family [Pseudomonas pohangensis]
MILQSRTVRLRLIEPSDAEFVLSLRMDARYNQFLSAVAPDVAAQREWIDRYKRAEADGSQFYFIIERNDGAPCGTIRVYDLRDDSFCWGSWILNDSKTRFSALESAFLIYEFGFNVLKFSKSHFEVMKGNERVISFHKKMGAKVTGEDEQNLYFEITQESVEVCKNELASKVLQ